MAALVWLTLYGAALAQGFAGLGTQAEGFAVPNRDTLLQFPRDHGPHNDFRIEWWYVTATLQGDDGRAYGVQWTLFRSALAPGEAPGWRSPQVWLGHAALTTPDQHFVAERWARGGIGQAGVTASPFEAWIDHWSMKGPGDDRLGQLHLTASGADFAYDLELNSNRPLVLQGTGGYSVKSADGQASHYYSQPFYNVSGTIRTPDGPVAVTGQAWLDREWSSQPLARDQSGWDWFSLVFDDGDRMMAFRLRGERGDFTSGTWIGADGSATPIPDGDIRMTPVKRAEVAGRDIPIIWELAYPERDLDLTITALNPDSWMGTSFPYWEGPVTISGSRNGRGYLEMTGYPPRR